MNYGSFFFMPRACPLRITKNSIQNLVDSISLSEHLRRYLEIRRSGSNSVAKCPFHQDSSPSLYIYPRHYHCFACGAHGNIIDYEIHRTGQTFRETVEQLSGLYHVAIEHENNLETEQEKKRHYLFEAQNQAFEKLQKHLRENFIAQFGSETKLSLFVDVGYIANDSYLDESHFDLRDFQTGPNESWKQGVSQRITFPLYKENGKICGFAVSQKIDSNWPHLEDKLPPFKIISSHKFISPLLNWHHARGSATKEKQLILTQSVGDALFFMEKEIKNVAIYFGDKIDSHTTKNVLNKIDKIIFVLPFSKEGKEFLWKTFQETYNLSESNFFVSFLKEEKEFKDSFFSNNSSEKIRTWLTLSEKMIYKVTEIALESCSNYENKISEFKEKILPFVHKIYDPERKKAILKDLAQKYFESSSPDLFYQRVSSRDQHVSPRGLTAGSREIGLDPAVKPRDDIKTPRDDIKTPRGDIKTPRDDTKTPRGDTHRLRDIISRSAEFYHKILESKRGHEARGYLKTRGLTPEHMAQWKLGLCPVENELSKRAEKGLIPQDLLSELGIIRKAQNKNQFYDFFYNRIIIPIKSHNGNIVALAGRTFQNSDVKNSVSKYINSPESELFSKSRILFHFYDAIDAIVQNKYVIVVEGYMDCIALVNAGVKNVVAVMGTALTTSHIQSLSKLTDRILLCFDNDKAGQAAARRSFQASHIYPNISLEYMSLPSGKDPDEFIKQYGREKFLEIAQNKKIPLFEQVCQWIALESHDQQDLIKLFEKNFAPILNKKNSIPGAEIIPFVKERYDIDLRKLIKNDCNPLQNLLQTPSDTTPASKQVENETPIWSIQSPLEIKFLFALVYLKFTELPQRLSNLIQNQLSENENNEKICALSLKSQLSPIGFNMLLELSTWMLAQPERRLGEIENKDEISHFSSASQILFGYTTQHVRTLLSFQLEELLKEHLSRNASVVTYQNVWSLSNSGFLKFHLHNTKLAFQSSILPSSFADTLLQLEVDYIDSTLKALSSFHFDNDVNEQFQYYISERTRRRVEFKTL